MAEPRNQFTFYRSYFDAIQELNKKDQSAIILAVCAYAIYETEPQGLSPTASTAFKLIRPTLDAGRRKAESGKQGGSKLKANRKQTVREKEIEVEKEIEIEKEIEVEVESSADAIAAATADRKLKLFHGELGQGVVFLSEAQIEDLLNRLDLDGFDYYVDKLASFIIKNGAKVKNHYETILRWWRQDSGLEADNE